VPNLVWVFGYFRASWTLRVDLLGDFVCRLLNHMKTKGVKRVTPELRPEDKDMQLGPWMDPEDFNPGYLQRGGHLLPKAGNKPEWRHSQDYWREKDELPTGLEDGDAGDDVIPVGQALAVAQGGELGRAQGGDHLGVLTVLGDEGLGGGAGLF